MRTKGRPKGPVKVVYKRRVLPEKVKELDGLLDGREPEAVVSQAPIVIESNEVVKLRAEVDRLRKRVKEYEQMYSGS